MRNNRQKRVPWWVWLMPIVALAIAGVVFAIRWSARGLDPDLPKWRLKTPAEWTEILAHDNPNARQLARDSLIKYGSESVPHLVEVLEEGKSPEAMTEAAQAIAEIGPDAKEAAPHLRRLLQQRNWEGRDLAARALGSIGDDSAETRRLLIETMADDDDVVTQIAAINAFGALPADAATIDALVKMLDENEMSMIRVAAAKALGNMGPAAASAEASLRKAAQSENMALSDAARQALKKLNGG